MRFKFQVPSSKFGIWNLESGIWNVLGLFAMLIILAVLNTVSKDWLSGPSTNRGFISTNRPYRPLPITGRDLYQSGSIFDQTFWKLIPRSVVNYHRRHFGNMREPLLAGILSLLIPGLGQLYNGRIVIGIIWLVLTGVSWIGSAGMLGWVVHLIAAWCAYSFAKDNPIR